MGMRIEVLLLLSAAAAFAGPAELQKAELLYQHTQYQQALAIVTPLLGKDPAAHLLAGRAAFMAGDYKKANEYLERATLLNPASSDAFLWLGRNFGRRAETSMPITAPHYASKARQNFERAVQLDPRNFDAINDLFDYYLQAPGFLGGGFEKAEALLPKIKVIDGAEYEYALAQLSEARKDFNNAEQHLKRAAELAPKSVGRVLDVARFLARRGRFKESFSWIGNAEKIAPQDPKVMFETARTKIQAKEDLQTARTLLQEYLKAPLNPDLPSRAEAQKLLKQASGAD